MDGTVNQDLPEQLAALLDRASGNLRSEVRSRRERLEARKAELASLTVQPPNLTELRQQAEELAGAVATRREELTAQERTLAELRRREQELENRLQAAHDLLRSRCAALAAKLPLLDGSGAAGWVSWLDGWHDRNRRPFEPRAEWQSYFEERWTLGEALARLEPCVRQIHQLEVEEGELGITRSSLPTEIVREEERIRQLETAISERLQQIGARYGRIVEDLPEPRADDMAARLEQIEGLLKNLEITLGRFAASARLESQMLEALQ
jgi:DNA repair exonuclease SbcCD ATPase subunit